MPLHEAGESSIELLLRHGTPLGGRKSKLVARRDAPHARSMNEQSSIHRAALIRDPEYHRARAARARATRQKSRQPRSERAPKEQSHERTSHEDGTRDEPAREGS